MLPDSLSQNYTNDGVVYIPRALSKNTLMLAQQAYDWSLAHPGPGAAALPAKGDGTFYQDLANPGAFKAYAELLTCPEFATIATTLWQKPDVWFMYEQVFKKSGGSTRRTPWHQDTPYLPVQGSDLAVMWISFDAVKSEQALEFVKGSHKGVLYDGSRFDPTDDTLPLYGDGLLPRLPDIEADRSQWPIVSWATQPGDVLVFHPAILHGGGDTDAATPRRTLSLRFFGADAVVAERPGKRPVETKSLTSDTVHPLTYMRTLTPGTPFRDPRFPKIAGSG
jgi:ectoine hydroxylase-related dioxygenase (phytanoyl-CoA dioxygenase family)